MAKSGTSLRLAVKNVLNNCHSFPPEAEQAKEESSQTDARMLFMNTDTYQQMRTVRSICHGRTNRRTSRCTGAANSSELTMDNQLSPPRDRSRSAATPLRVTCMTHRETPRLLFSLWNCSRVNWGVQDITRGHFEQEGTKETEEECFSSSLCLLCLLCFLASPRFT